MTSNVEVSFIWSALDGEHRQRSIGFKNYLDSQLSDTRRMEWDNGDVGWQVYATPQQAGRLMRVKTADPEYRLNELTKAYGLTIHIQGDGKPTHDLEAEGNGQFMQIKDDVISNLMGTDGRLAISKKETPESVLEMLRLNATSKRPKPKPMPIPEEPESFIIDEKPDDGAERPRGFQAKATPEANGIDKTVSKTASKTESKPKPVQEPMRATVHVFDTEKARAIVPRQDVCKGFPPPGEVSALAGKAGVGKTSLIMHYVAEATKKGHRALIWSFDMAYDFLCQYLLAYGAVSEHVTVIDGTATFSALTEQIENIKELLGDKDAPLLFVPDPFVDMFGTCSGEFMYNERTEREAEFNPNDQLSWVRAFCWFLPFVRENRLSVLGTCHPAKGIYGHDLPHSAKLQGYLHSWSILYRHGMNMRGFPEQWLVEALKRGKKGSRLIYNGKGRGGHGLQHVTFEYGEQVDKKVLNPNVTYVPSVIDSWTDLEEEDFEQDEFDTSTGKGGVKTFSDDTIIGTILEEADESNSVSTYDLRRKLKIADNDSLTIELLYGQLHRLRDEKKLEKKQYGRGCQWKAL